MSETFLPFMMAAEEPGGDGPDWVRLYCDLCTPEWRTMDGRLRVCEDEAAEHLEQIHPRRYDAAINGRKLRY